MRGLALPFFGVLMSFNKEDLLVNIKRQAKRLSKLLTIPLGQAQEALAICLYGCDSYSDLLVKIKDPFTTSVSIHIYLLLYQFSTH